MKLEVQRALDELRRCFGEAEVTAHSKPDGGAIVTIESIDLGSAYTPQFSWIKFGISFQYPYADVYPLFVHPDVVRSDGRPHGNGISLGSFEGQGALQLSRRSNRWDPAVDTVALKVTKVIQWFKEQ